MNNPTTKVFDISTMLQTIINTNNNDTNNNYDMDYNNENTNNNEGNNCIIYDKKNAKLGLSIKNDIHMHNKYDNLNIELNNLSEYIHNRINKI